MEHIDNRQEQVAEPGTVLLTMVSAADVSLEDSWGNLWTADLEG